MPCHYWQLVPQLLQLQGTDEVAFLAQHGHQLAVQDAGLDQVGAHHGAHGLLEQGRVGETVHHEHGEGLFGVQSQESSLALGPFQPELRECGAKGLCVFGGANHPLIPETGVDKPRSITGVVFEQLLGLLAWTISSLDYLWESGAMASSGARRTISAARPRPGGTRQALIVAATSSLRDVGFAHASAREIARRAGCNQSQVFYHFGSVVELLLAALDDVSASRMAAYRSILEQATTLTGLVESAQTILTEDLDSGDVRVLVEMITGAQSVPGLGDQVAQRLVPWNAFAEEAVQRALSVVPLGSLVSAPEVAHVLVAGLLGLELLANLDGDRTQAISLFGRARMLAGLLEMTGALPGMPAPEQS